MNFMAIKTSVPVLACLKQFFIGRQQQMKKRF